jgi:hypothetical protein
MEDLGVEGGDKIGKLAFTKKMERGEAGKMAAELDTNE